MSIADYVRAVESGWTYAPAAFVRHGVLPDPRDLDRRGGERHDWVA